MLRKAAPRVNPLPGRRNQGGPTLGSAARRFYGPGRGYGRRPRRTDFPGAPAGGRDDLESQRPAVGCLTRWLPIRFRVGPGRAATQTGMIRPESLRSAGGRLRRGVRQPGFYGFCGDSLPLCFQSFSLSVGNSSRALSRRIWRPI